jgi:proton-translocating NADH-quinone oxidoreductase chain M
MLLLFNTGTSGFQYQSELFPGLWLGVDGISIWLVWLVTLISPIVILHSTTTMKKGTYRYHFERIGRAVFILLIQIVVFWSIAVFLVLDIFLFYICFEGVLIPMYFLIMFYGSRNRKIAASYGLLIYTVLGSLFLLAIMVRIYLLTGTSSYQSLLLYDFGDAQYSLWFGFFIALAVKIPMIPFHLWLPEAHVEAPTGVSIILASIVLKLGTYGFIRFSLTLFPQASIYFSPMVITLALVGLLYTSLISLAQVDIKKIIAYSSIGHMNLATIGIFSNTLAGLEGSLYFMVSHGLISGGLFLVIGTMYERYHTRTYLYFRGLALVYPVFSAIFFIFTLGNIGVPGTSGFLSEFLTLLGSFEYNPFVGLLASLTIVLSPLYSLWLYNRIVFGSLSNHFLIIYKDISLKEFHALFPLVFGTLYLGFFPQIILNTSL